MPELTLESLAARLAEVERKLATWDGVRPATRDWREVIGKSEDNEFTRSMRAEMAAIKEAERQAALRGDEE